MFRSDEPWAMAMTLTPAPARDEKTRPAMPGVPAIPSPTTAITARPVPRRDVVDEPRGQLLPERLLERGHRPAAPRTPASVNPIELSDEAWKIVETDSPSAWTAPNVRAAMPETPTIPFPATVTTAWWPDRGQRLHRVPGESLAARDLGPRSVRVNERTDVEDHAGAGQGNERPRMQDLRAVVGDLGRLAVVELRDEAGVGNGPRVGGQDSRARPSRGRRAARPGSGRAAWP